MKKQRFLLVIIFLSVVTFAFSACQKNAIENVQVESPISSSSLTSNANPTPSPNSDESDSKAYSQIKKIDFKNFSYPWTDGLISDSDKTFTIKNGERPFVMNGQMGITLAKIKYADLTGDGEDEALIDLSVQTGGTAVPDMIYIYSLKNKEPKLLWSFDTGDRADGGFKDFYVENGELVIETFGESKFENDKWIFRLPENKFRGYCCPTAFTKIRFKWNGEKFVVKGKPELFDYDDPNNPRRNLQ